MMGGWVYRSGASGAVAVPDGAKVKQIKCIGPQGATMVIGSGEAVDVSDGFREDLWGYLHGPVDVVFNGTNTYFVSWVE